MLVIDSRRISNNACVNIYGANNGEVYAGLNQSKPRTYKIYQDSKGIYFKFRGIRIQLN